MLLTPTLTEACSVSLWPGPEQGRADEAYCNMNAECDLLRKNRSSWPSSSIVCLERKKITGNVDIFCLTVKVDV